MNFENWRSAEEWNEKYPVGTPVRYYPIAGEDHSITSKTRSVAWNLGSGHPVVLIEGSTGGKFLAHIEPLGIENTFTEEEVRNLNDFQDSGVGHPFTCENGCGNLIAKTDGWHCPKCDYRQYWAHKAMLDGSWRKWSLFG